MSPTLNTDECARLRHIDPHKDVIQYGDVIGFKASKNATPYVFRVIAKAGDTIGMENGQVILNGQPLAQVSQGSDETVVPKKRPHPRCENPAKTGETCTRNRLTETLPTGRSYDIFDIGQTRSDDMAEVTVPPAHLFVLGDHRDNANDSRFDQESFGPGFVALDSVLGIFDGL